jgi:ABC-type transport system involved in cytochrome bd biosynthesis fused ATPase/permease subunit
MTEPSGWPKRAEKLNDKVEHTLTRYRNNKIESRRLHQILSLTILIGAVLAPILTTLAARPDAGVAPQFFAILVGLAMAVSEGIRRLLRPETRWKATAIAVQRIVMMREAYRDQIVDLPVGSEDWKAAYLAFKGQFEAILLKETVEFFPDEPDQARATKSDTVSRAPLPSATR